MSLVNSSHTIFKLEGRKNKCYSCDHRLVAVDPSSIRVFTFVPQQRKALGSQPR